MFGGRTLRWHPEAGQLLVLAVGHVRYAAARTGIRIGDVLLGVDELLQFLLLGQGIAFGLRLVFDLLLAFELFQFATVLVLFGDDVLQDGLLVEEEAFFSAVEGISK